MCGYVLFFLSFQMIWLLKCVQRRTHVEIIGKIQLVLFESAPSHNGERRGAAGPRWVSAGFGCCTTSEGTVTTRQRNTLQNSRMYGLPV